MIEKVDVVDTCKRHIQHSECLLTIEQELRFLRKEHCIYFLCLVKVVNCGNCGECGIFMYFFVIVGNYHW